MKLGANLSNFQFSLGGIVFHLGLGGRYTKDVLKTSSALNLSSSFYQCYLKRFGSGLPPGVVKNVL